MKVKFGELPHHKEYSVTGMKGNKLFFTRRERTGIYFTDYKTTKLSRVINKNGYIKLDNCEVYVFDIEGVEFHYNEYLTKKGK